MVTINPSHLYDAETERAFIGGAMHFPERLDGEAPELAPSDFYVPLHQAIYQALLELTAEGADARNELVLTRRIQSIYPHLDEGQLQSLRFEGVTPRRDYAEIILRHSAGRRALVEMTSAATELAKGSDPYEVAATTAKALDEVGLSAGGEPEAVTLEELLERAQDGTDWVINGLLRADWRMVVVAQEGAGKSTLLRQFAVCAAQGIHPLWLRPAIKPVRTLIVDAENGPGAIAETGEPLSMEAGKLIGDRYDSERCKIWSRPAGLDLRKAHNRAALVREIRAQRPQLVVMGPVYKLGRRGNGENYEDVAESVQEILDDLRMRFGFALLLEHHAPKGDGSGRREMAPFGSQRWLAWPEFGRGLVKVKADELADAQLGDFRDEYNKPDGERVFKLDTFRGDRVRAEWPQYLVRSNGTGWPWRAAAAAQPKTQASHQDDDDPPF